MRPIPSCRVSGSTFPISRRRFLQSSTAALTAAWCGSMSAAVVEEEGRPPVRQITHGPKFHWFGYYDKLQFDPTGRYALGMEVDFEHRSPGPEDVVKIGMVDLDDGDRWIELGSSRAWCWQQGCMLQWLPSSADEIIWNDRGRGGYVCHILNVKTKARRTIGHPIYCVSPDGRWAIAPDFRRLADTRPGYGYNGIPDPNRDVLAPADVGIFRIDLQTGKQELLISLADAAKIPFLHGDISRAKHWFNHLLINPDGSRFEFLHRWQNPDAKGFQTRMFTAAPDGLDLRIIDDNGSTSHFNWRDPEHILAWSKYQPPGGFFLFEDKPGVKVTPVLMTADGHCSYLPGNQWIVCDTYPDRQHNQNVYLYHVPSQRRVWLGHFLSPKEYAGEWRCDTHPRLSRDGRWVAIDSPHAGQGRQLHLIDISGITG